MLVSCNGNLMRKDPISSMAKDFAGRFHFKQFFIPVECMGIEEHWYVRHWSHR
ncbi:MAG: hypothetical protein ACMUEM_05345 [Flavobacteriales bacterium AspAUS03]